MRKRLLLLVLVALFFNSFSYSQRLLENIQRSKYTYIYKLDKHQGEYIYRNSKITDKDFLFTNLYDSILYNEVFDYEKLQVGQYLFIHANAMNAFYYIYEVSAFHIKTLGVNDELYLYVYDLQGNPVKNANVTVYEKGEIDFSPDCGCYSMKVDKKKEPSEKYFAMIEREGEFQYIEMNYSFPPKVKPERKSKNKEYRENAKKGHTILPGYFVLNQPKYELLDSLKGKAFILKPNGKPYRRKLNLYCYNLNQNKIIFRKEIKPETRGDYFFDFQIPDSFQLDNQYSFQFRTRKNRIVKKADFRIENYDLQEAYFNASISKNLFYAGEEVTFNISSFDANKLPLMDAKVKLNVSLQSVDDWFSDSMFIPYKWFQSYFEYENLVDPSGITQITLPDSLFLNAKMRFRASVELWNSDNERKYFNLYFTFDPTKKRYEFYIDGDSIRAEYLYNSKPKSKKASIAAFHGKKVYEKEVILPYAFHVEEYPTNYELKVGEDVVSRLNIADIGTHVITFEGERDFNNINFKMVNHLGLEVSYKIYLGSKQIDGGSGRALDYSREINSEESVHIIYSYRWRGQVRILEKSFHAKEKELTVEIDQPDVIYPGQKVPVTILVKDYKGNPRKKVNLAAYAVNGQFQNIPEPEIPYFGKTKGGILTHFHADNRDVQVQANFPLNHFFANLLNIYDAAYYRLMINEKGLGKEYEDIKEVQPEVAFFVLKNRNVVKPFAIYIDKKPIFYETSRLTQYNSFRVDTGIHTIDIRTFDKMITIKNVEFRKNKKLFLSIDIDSIPNIKNVSYVDMEPPFLKEERKPIKESTLFFRSYHHAFYLKQGKRVFYINNINRYQQYFTSSNILLEAGPFEKGDIEVYTVYDTQSFYFDPAFAYRIYKDSIVADDIEQFKVKFNDYKFSNSYVTPSFQDRALKLPEPQPKQVNAQQQQQKPQPQPKAMHPGLKAYGLNYSTPPHAMFHVKNNSGKYMTRVWLFNKSEIEYSKIYFNNLKTIQYIKPGLYDMVFITSDSMMCRMNGYELLGGGNNYIIVDTNEFEKINLDLLEIMEDQIIKLNTPPVRPFNNPPTIIDEVDVALKKKDVLGLMTGFVFDSRGYPFDMVTLLIEKQGVFVAGAFSNQMGYFEIKDLNPGDYQVKIFHQGRFYNFYSLKVYEYGETHVRFYLPYGSGSQYRWPANDKTTYITNQSSPSYSNIESDYSNIQATSYSVEEVSIISSRKLLNVQGIANFDNIPRMDLSFNFNTTKDYQNLTGNEPENKMKDFFERIKSDSSANRIRNNFRDYAYFMPNLLTNRKGEAHFTVIYPDNQTIWKTYVPAIDYKKHTGLGKMETKAYKPLSANLALPKFLLENDKVKLKGKILNYTEEEINLTSKFELNDRVLKSNELKVKNFDVEDYYLKIEKEGDYQFTYSFKTSDNYVDGEKRDLPVNPNGIVSVKSKHFTIDEDSSFTIEPDNTLLKRTLLVTNSRLDLVRDEIRLLKEYNYGCNEQNASKLKALLVEKTLDEAIGREFKNDKLVVQLIKKLEKTQRKDGAWGWWNKENTANIWMTVYIAEALKMAHESGYSTRSHITAAKYLKDYIHLFDISDQLFSLNLLVDFYNRVDFIPYVNKYDTLDLSLKDEFQLIRLKQKLELEYNVDTILTSIDEHKDGFYWGEQVLNFKTNLISTSAIAYDILKNDEKNHSEIEQKVRSYFLENRDKHLNTVDRAVFLQTFVNDILEGENTEAEIVSYLMVNNRKVETKEFPVFEEYKNDEKVTIEKKGSPLHFSIYNYNLDRNPQLVDSLFVINSFFEDKKDTARFFKMDEQIDYWVRLKSKRKTEYVMVEIPIPAGCFYAEKSISRAPNETYREYYDDKVVMFLRIYQRGITISV
jgi:hypothetical protein